MGFRFRRSVRLLPGVRINLGGRRGPSITVGARGASLNVGPRGTYLNAGVPGTGVSYRERLDSEPETPRQEAPPSLPGGRPSWHWGWLLVLLIGIAIGAALF